MKIRPEKKEMENDNCLHVLFFPSTSPSRTTIHCAEGGEKEKRWKEEAIRAKQRFSAARNEHSLVKPFPPPQQASKQSFPRHKTITFCVTCRGGAQARPCPDQTCRSRREPITNDGARLDLGQRSTRARRDQGHARPRHARLRTKKATPKPIKIWSGTGSSEILVQSFPSFPPPAEMTTAIGLFFMGPLENNRPRAKAPK